MTLAVRVAIELLIVIVILVTIVVLIMASRKVNKSVVQRKGLPPVNEEDLARFDELLKEHEDLHRNH